MRFKAKPWELVFDLLSKWVLGRDFKAKLEAQGKEIEAQGKKIEAQGKKIEAQEKELELRLQRIGEKSEQGWFQRMESGLSALEAEIIWRAPTLEEARRIYEGFRAAPQTADILHVVMDALKQPIGITSVDREIKAIEHPSRPLP